MSEYENTGDNEGHNNQDNSNNYNTTTDLKVISSEHTGLPDKGEGSKTRSETELTTNYENYLGVTKQNNDSGLTQALTEVGADENYIAKALFDMTSAYKEVHVGDGETITIADNNIRHKAIETILKIRGDLKEKRNTLKADTQVNYIIVN